MTVSSQAEGSPAWRTAASASPFPRGRAESLVTPEHCIRWSDRACVWLCEPISDSTRSARTLTGSSPMVFRFLLPVDAADSLDLRFATWDRVNTHPVICELLGETGAPLRRVELSPSAIQDGVFHQIADLRGLSAEQGRALRMRLTSPAATDEDGFAVWVRQAPLRLHQPTRRLVAFRTARIFLYPAQGRPAADPPCTALLPLAGADRLTDRPVVDVVSKAFPGATVELGPASTLQQVWEQRGAATVVFLTDAVFRLGSVADFDGLCLTLHRRGVCTVFVETAELALGMETLQAIGPLKEQLSAREATRRRCRFTLLADGRLNDNAAGPQVGGARLDWPMGPQSGTARLRALTKAARDRWAPPITIIARTPRTAEAVRDLVESCIAQTYPGALSLILIGAGGVARLADDVRSALADRALTAARDLRECDDWREAAAMLASEGGSGADLIVLRGEGRWSPEFLAAHAFEHADAQAAVCFGDVVAKPNDAPPSAHANLARPDPVQAEGFLNCTSSNVSFPRRLAQSLNALIQSLLIDDPVHRRAHELACVYQAYLAGTVFRHAAPAILFQADDETSEECAAQTAGLADLIRDQPELALVARRALRPLGPAASSAGRGALRAPRRLRILSYRWHAPHQYELHKLPHRFTLATELGANRFIDRWPFAERPLRPNVELRSAREIDSRDYDLAIVHFDENVFATHLSNGELDASWGDPAAWLLRLPDLPKIAVCHGTPPFVGQFAAVSALIGEFEIHGGERRVLTGALASAGAKVVCNSWQALADWGFKDARVIWHGFDPQEFPPATYERGVLALEPDWRRPHYRGAFEARAALAALEPGIEVGAPVFEAPVFEARQTNGYATRSFCAYVDAVRRFSVYLNTTLRSPMPRSRGEAMMIGLAPVTLRNHDVERFIDNGVNGFYADEPGQLADFINHLFSDPDRPRLLGQAARRTALDLFNHDRFLTAWTDLIDETI